MSRIGVAEASVVAGNDGTWEVAVRDQSGRIWGCRQKVLGLGRRLCRIRVVASRSLKAFPNK